MYFARADWSPNPPEKGRQSGRDSPAPGMARLIDTNRAFFTIETKVLTHSKPPVLQGDSLSFVFYSRLKDQTTGESSPGRYAIWST